jgi:hypothetical protein
MPKSICDRGEISDELLGAHVQKHCASGSSKLDLAVSPEAALPGIAPVLLKGCRDSPKARPETWCSESLHRAPKVGEYPTCKHAQAIGATRTLSAHTFAVNRKQALIIDQGKVQPSFQAHPEVGAPIAKGKRITL